jgi:tRNA G18 (ribose-2'-O)-methylase SpoU
VAVVAVHDPDDARIANYRSISDAVLLTGRQLFVAEGRHVVRRLLAGDRLVADSVLVTAPALAALATDLDPRAVTVYLVPQAVMDAVVGFNVHRGCLALGRRSAPLDWRQLAGGARRLVALERVGNPDNVGAIFRNAAAFGADAVLLGPDCADPLYRKAIRTSMAAALSVPFAHALPWPAALHELRAGGMRVIGLSPAAGAPSIRDVLASCDGRATIVVGHEGDGLTQETMTACDTLARIPMMGAVDSLNVATACGIALYELAATEIAATRPTGKTRDTVFTRRNGGTGTNGVIT